VGGNRASRKSTQVMANPASRPLNVYSAGTNMEVLAFRTGNPEKPVNAIPAHAFAYMQIRFVVGTDWKNLEQIVRRHLDERALRWSASRWSGARRHARGPDNALVKWAGALALKTHYGRALCSAEPRRHAPNDAFAEILGMPTLWAPHSYPVVRSTHPTSICLDRSCERGLRHHGRAVPGIWANPVDPSRRLERRSALMSTESVPPFLPGATATCQHLQADCRDIDR